MLARSPLTTWMLMATMVRTSAAQTLITLMAATSIVETMLCLMMQLDQSGSNAISDGAAPSFENRIAVHSSSFAVLRLYMHACTLVDWQYDSRQYYARSLVVWWAAYFANRVLIDANNIWTWCYDICAMVNVGFMCHYEQYRLPICIKSNLIIFYSIFLFSLMNE